MDPADNQFNFDFFFYGRSGDGPGAVNNFIVDEYGFHRFAAQFKESCRQKNLQRKSKKFGRPPRHGLKHGCGET